MTHHLQLSIKTDNQLYTVWVNPLPLRMWHFPPNGWEILVQILNAHYTLLSMLDYKFLFNYLQLWWSYAILSATTQFTPYAQNVKILIDWLIDWLSTTGWNAHWVKQLCMCKIWTKNSQPHTVEKTHITWYPPRPIESHSGAQENIIAGPYHPLHSVCLEIETPKASRERRKRGERCPLTIRLGVWGSVVSSQRGPGHSPGRKWILCIF